MECMSNVKEEFGSLVFDDRVMKSCLPEKVYRSLRKTIDEGMPLDLSVANAVADAMKEWGIAYKNKMRQKGTRSAEQQEA